MHKLLIAILSFAMLLGTVLVVPSVSAQNNMSDYNTAPGTTTDDTGTLNSTDTQDDGFNWWWLLPLLAIPLILMARRGSNDRKESQDRGQFAGVKGGRQEREGM
jgi:1,4-dihydroxy-2-naphthoate octaprenyltransferase